MSDRTQAAVVDDATDPTEGLSQEEIERKARQQGWRPLSEYRGPENGFRDAAEYLRTGETELPIVRARNRLLQNEVERLRRKQEQAQQLLVDVSERVRTTEQRAYERAERELAAQQRSAAESADVARFDRVQAELAELRKSPPKPLPAITAGAMDVPSPPPEEAVEWANRNEWFRTDSALRAEALELSNRLIRSEPGLTVAENLERTTEAMRAMYPGRVPARARAAQQERREPDDEGGTVQDDTPAPDNPRRREAAAVAPSRGGPAIRRARGPSFESLPKDAKDQFYRFQTQIGAKAGAKPLTKEEWVDLYYEGEQT